MKAMVKVTRTVQSSKTFEVEVDDKELIGHNRIIYCLHVLNEKARQMAADMEFSTKDSQYHSSIVEITEGFKGA